MSERKVLFARNRDDDFIYLIWYWASKLIEYARKLEYEITDVADENATRTNFHAAIKERNPCFVVGHGHGGTWRFTGTSTSGVDEMNLLTACLDDDAMANRIVYLMSCLTGCKLGPSMVSKGAKAFLGWVEPFAVPYGTQPWDERIIPEYEPVSKPFMDFTNTVAVKLMAGSFVDRWTIRAGEGAFPFSLERANAWIDYYSKFGFGLIIDVLIGDRDSFMYAGDSSAQVIWPPREKPHQREIYALDSRMWWTSPDQPIKFRFVVACQVAHCPFLNKKYWIIDSNGRIVAIGYLTNYIDNGLTWTEVELAAHSPGLYQYTIVVSKDGMHPEERKQIFIYVPTPSEVKVAYLEVVRPDFGGYTDPSIGTYEFLYDTEVAITAIPEKGYSLKNWLVNDEVKIENPLILKMDKDYDVKPIFRLAYEFTLNISSSHGGITDPEAGIYTKIEGETVEVTAIPEEGYFFQYWVLDGEERAENPISVVMDKDYRLYGVFKSPEEIEPVFPRVREILYNFPRIANIYDRVDEIRAKG